MSLTGVPSSRSSSGKEDKRNAAKTHKVAATGKDCSSASANWNLWRRSPETARQYSAGWQGGREGGSRNASWGGGGKGCSSTTEPRRCSQAEGHPVQPTPDLQLTRLRKPEMRKTSALASLSGWLILMGLDRPALCSHGERRGSRTKQGF